MAMLVCDPDLRKRINQRLALLSKAIRSSKSTILHLRIWVVLLCTGIRLGSYGCEQLREGGNHPWWWNPS
ncbi:MAG: hypothetical protein VKO39_06245 [Cyanobacteriota bacterium]|nr:hypothetical protein [Cyanobacteriota bacterium]